MLRNVALTHIYKVNDAVSTKPSLNSSTSRLIRNAENTTNDKNRYSKRGIFLFSIMQGEGKLENFQFDTNNGYYLLEIVLCFVFLHVFLVFFCFIIVVISLHGQVILKFSSQALAFHRMNVKKKALEK